MTDPIEAMHKAVMAYVFFRAQPDRGDVFSWLDDHPELMAVAYAALRETLVPVGWVHSHPNERRELEFFRLTNRDRMNGWTETPLFALPEIKP